MFVVAPAVACSSARGTKLLRTPLLDINLGVVLTFFLGEALYRDLKVHKRPG